MSGIPQMWTRFVVVFRWLLALAARCFASFSVQRGRALANWRRLRGIVVAAVITLTVLVGPGGALTTSSSWAVQAQTAAIQAHPTPRNIGAPDKPNTFNPLSDTSSAPYSPPTYATPAGPTKQGPQTPHPIIRPFTATMKPATVPLHPGAATQFTSSDGRLGVTLPASAVTASDVTAHGGALSLRITQVAGPSGSVAGGSGEVSLGQYLVQLVDAQGYVVPATTLHAPLTFTLHLSTGDLALDLSNVLVVVNGAHPVQMPLAQLPPTPISVGHHTAINGTPGGSIPGATIYPLGAPSSGAATFDAATRTLTASLTPASLGGVGGSVSYNSNSPVALFGSPDPFTVDLNAGGLSASYPLSVPSGPGGLTPPVALTYSSAAVAGQHNDQAPASWVGEGFDLSLGAITWDEHNSNSTCNGSCGNGWESTWDLTDPYGTSVQLIPPTVTTTTYTDDSGLPLTASPIAWQTTPDDHARIYSYNTTFTLPGQSVTPRCFRVYLPNGLMEEFGCTSNSLQYYTTASNGDRVTAWNLDLITDPQGNQIQITYQSNMVSGHNGTNYPREMELATVEWDAPTCQNASVRCPSTGSAPNLWNPLHRVVFDWAHTPARITGTSGTCNPASGGASPTQRCDDPLNLSGSGGLAAPDVENTNALNDAQVETRASGGATTWNTLLTYNASYAVAGPQTVTQDPVTGKPVSHAGSLLLTMWQTVGDDGATTLPPVQFTYTNPKVIASYYEDSNYVPAPTTNCGPAWNTGNGSGCLLWSNAGPSNSEFIATSSNGQGLASSYTWSQARNNTHGVNSGLGSPANPLACDYHENSGYPCDETDDQNWSRYVLTEQDASAIRASSNGNATITGKTYYSYFLTYPLSEQECSDCVAGMYWGNQDDGDVLDYYNGMFMGFTEANVQQPDGSIQKHYYYATNGYGIYDTSRIACNSFTPPCHNDPYWAYGTALHGQEYKLVSYDTNGTTPLSETTTQYNTACPPSGVGATPNWTNAGGQLYNWDGELVAELDHDNPVAACDIQTSSTTSYTLDGAAVGSSSAPQLTTTYSYDSYGRMTSQTATSNGGGGAGSPATIVSKSSYIQNDALTANATGVTGHYLVDDVAFTDTEDSSGNRYACVAFGFDGGVAGLTGQQAGLTLGEATTTTSYATNCAAGSLAGPLTTTAHYDSSGDAEASTDADANAGVSGHVGCTVPDSGSTQYTSCQQYDSTYAALPTVGANALNQTSSIGYGSATDASGGFGLWPLTTTDANGQTTTATYDPLGRLTSTTLPGETTGDTTGNTTYTVWCGTSMAAQAPCVEVDTTQRVDSGDTVTSRSFYDGFGNLVETRDQAPGGEDVVQYNWYTPDNQALYQSISYFVSAYTGGPGASAFSTPDATQAGTSYNQYDGLGRLLNVNDPLSHITSTTYKVECGWQSPDTGCYEYMVTVDPLNHQTISFSDALGRDIYDQTFTGTSPSTYMMYTQTKQTYNYVGQLIQFLWPDYSTTTSFGYDLAGRETSMSDPDRGASSIVYDANGNPTETVDARGASGTIYAGYDGLNRQVWRNTTNSATGAYVTYSYDSTTGGNLGVGRLTGEAFNNSNTAGPALSGSYTYAYDNRGQVTGSTLTVDGTGYATSATYDDAGQPLTQTYPDGDVVTTSYTGQGWLGSLSVLQQGASQSVSLVNDVAYVGTLGAVGTPTSEQWNGGTYTYSTTGDALLRPTDTKITGSGGTTLYDVQPSYDAASNVIGVATTLPTGTDNQAFCYDDLDRLTWAGATGMPPCGGSLTAGTLTSAQYTQTFTYDTFDRLTSSPSGSYTYGNSSHKDAATSLGSAYTVAYDAVGDMVCRAPTASTTCAGTPTGASLSYDNEGRLATWQNTPSSPTTTDSFLYDGEGNRIEQVVQQSGVGETDTVYVGGLEEVTTTTPTGGQPTTSVTAYYGGIALSVNGTLSFLASDNLGSAEEALNTSGQVTASQLYTPYGDSRYSSGTFPTDQGFTGYRADSVTGLDYANARYYDPAAGQFVSADTTLAGGLNRYAYVGGSPETATDPSGHLECVENCDDGGGGESGSGDEGSGVGGEPGEEGASAFTYDSGTTSLAGVKDVPLADAGDVMETQQYYDGTTVNEVVNPETGAVDGAVVSGDTFEPEGVVNDNIEDPELAKENEVDRAQAENAEKDPQVVDKGGSGRGSETGAGSGNPPTVGNGKPPAPNFVVSPGGDVIPVPEGADGPLPVRTGKGFMYQAGQGGNGLAPNVTGVRIMDPIPARGTIPEYPGGYVRYSTPFNDGVDPWTGKSIPRSGSHFRINEP